MTLHSVLVPLRTLVEVGSCVLSNENTFFLINPIASLATASQKGSSKAALAAGVSVAIFVIVAITVTIVVIVVIV